MERVVLKLGTNVVTEQGGELAVSRLFQILDEFVPKMAGSQLILVSSGAVGLGRVRLGLSGELSLHGKQMCAAVGQAVLMQSYNMILSKQALTAAQVLLTSDDLTNGKCRKNLLATLGEMAEHPIVPIINENDTISTEELEECSDHSFGDNDLLSSLLAREVEASLLVVLTDIEGIFHNRREYEKGTSLGLVEDLSLLESIEVWSGSQAGRGGVKSKIEAARLAVEKGIPCWISSGLEEKNFSQDFADLSQQKVPSHGTFIISGSSLWKKS